MDRLASAGGRVAGRGEPRGPRVRVGMLGSAVAGLLIVAGVARAADPPTARASDPIPGTLARSEVFPDGAICAHGIGGPERSAPAAARIPTAPTSEVLIYQGQDLHVTTWTALLADPVTEMIPFEVREGVVGMVVRADARGSHLPISVELFAADGTVLACHGCPDAPAVGEVLPGRGASQMPSTNRDGWELKPGDYAFRVRVVPLIGTSEHELSTLVDVSATFRTEVAVEVEHRLDLNFVYLPNSGLGAAVATSEPLFVQMMKQVTDYLAPTGIVIGEVTHVDLDRPEFSRIATWEEAGRMFRTSRDVGRHRALNVYCVEWFDAPLNPVVGLSGGIPGPPFNGTRDSGIAIRTSPFFLCMPDCLPVFASLFAHEIGHYLGFYHTSEANLENWDPFSDTAECREANLRDCPDWGNAMFPVIHNENREWSPGQVAVAPTHPLVRTIPVVGRRAPGLAERESPAPSALHVSLAPSPFREQLRIQWSRAQSAPTRVGIYDIAGRRVRELTGQAEVTWDGHDLSGEGVAAGTYFVRVSDGVQTATRRVVKLP